MIEWLLASAEATEALGAAVAHAVQDACVIYLRGNLGTGKTTLVRGFLRALGHTGVVKSPTYTLVEIYSVADKQVFHFDFYRIADPEELEYIGVRDFANGQSILLVEWPERGQGMLPAADLDIEIRFSEDARVCCVNALSSSGRAILRTLKMTGDQDHNKTTEP